MRTALLLALAFAAPASADQRVVFNHFGDIIDEDNTPLSGSHALTVRIWGNSAQQVEEDPLWEETYQVTLYQGRYGFTIGERTGGRKELPVSVFSAGNDRWMSIAVDGDELLPRLRFGIVPRAWSAALAEDLACAVPGCVEESEIAADAVTAGKIAPGAVTGSAIAAEAITADKIADGAVTGARIAAGAITSGKIATGAVGAQQIAAGAVTSGAIAAGAVTNEKLEAMGPGSGLDADKIDGLDSGAFVRLQGGSLVTQTGDLAVSGSISGEALYGDGSALTSVDAATLGGKTRGQIAGDAANADNLTSGTLGGARLSGIYAQPLAFSNATNLFTGALTGSGNFASGALRLPSPGSAPACADTGAVYYSGTDKRIYVCDGTAWKAVGATLGALLWQEASLDFGSGPGGATRTATLRNTGDAALSGVTVVATSGFSVKTPCATSLAAGASCVVTFEIPGTGPAGARGGMGLASGTATGGAVSAGIALTGTLAVPATCKAIKDANTAATSATYTIDPDGAGTRAAFDVYCDMTTDGGGWTMVAKATGQDATMNRPTQTQWRQKNYIGSIANLTSENALGPSYDTVPFTDVMIRSLATPARNIGWRHPTTYTNMFAVVDAGQRVSDGVKLFGSISNLDYQRQPDTSYHNDCSTVKYGFFGYDWTQNYTTMAGHNLIHGHGGAIVAVSIFTSSHTANYGPDDGTWTRCVTDFGFGGGYDSMGDAAGQKNIQGHWWGNGNTYTSDFNAHGLFVR